MPVKTILFAFVLGMATAAVAADPGELKIYAAPSQNGTAARQIFTDEQKRPVREIYYQLAPGIKEALDESGLVAYQVRLYSYDEQGRQTWEGNYTPEMVLQRSLETSYDATGRLSTEQWREADGVVRYKTIRKDRIRISELYFDDSGEKLIGIRGSVPPDADLASGWGRAVCGIACGLGVNRNEGKPGDIQLNITLRNITDSEVEVLSADWSGNREIQMELRDANGHLIPSAGKSKPISNKESAGKNREAPKSFSSIRPKTCETFGRYYRLSEWYPNVPAGDYRLIVRRRFNGPDDVLVSRPVQLHIIAAQ